MKNVYDLHYIPATPLTPLFYERLLVACVIHRILFRRKLLYYALSSYFAEGCPNLLTAIS